MNKKIVATSLLVTCAIGLGLFVEKSQSATLTDASITLGNSRLSFHGRLDGTNTSGETLVNINSSVSAPYTSVTTAELVEGDVVTIQDVGGTNVNTYTVTERTDADTFAITTGLDAENDDAGDRVTLNQTGDITVEFDTVSVIDGGIVRVLFPSDGNAADDLPDPGAFEFGSATAATVTCDSGLPGSPTAGATANDVTIGSQDYHSFECDYTGANTAGTVVMTISDLINPAPTASHTTGTADTYIAVIQHLDGATVVDSTSVAIGAIEAVQVSATVAPQITFSIAGVSSGTSTCGVNTDATSTATAVPFGSLSINAFSTVSQALTVATNASNGYVVTVVENDQLGLDGQACAGESGVTNCIDDTSVADETTSADWTDASTENGFGYSLDDHDADATEAFAYDESSRTFSAKQFAATADSETPQTVMSDTTVTNGDDVYVCYRATISATQPAGLYYNYVTYTATATF